MDELNKLYESGNIPLEAVSELSNNRDEEGEQDAEQPCD